MKLISNSPNSFALPLSWVFFLILLHAFAPYHLSAAESKSRLPLKSDTIGSTVADSFPTPDIILVSEKKGWLIPLLLPYISASETENRLPSLLALPDEKADNFTNLLNRIRKKKILSFVNQAWLHRRYPINFPNLETVQLDDDPHRAAIQLFDRYIRSTAEIVITPLDKPTDLIQASAFASHFGLPVLPVPAASKPNTIEVALLQRKVSIVYWVSDTPVQPSISKSQFEVNHLTSDQAEDLVISKIGAGNIRNLILVNPSLEEQENQKPESNAAYFVPYIGLLRQAPLLLAHTHKGIDAENLVTDFIRIHHLSPRTVTIVGNRAMTTPIKADEPLREKIYNRKMELEPLSIPEKDFAIAFGIGRLPFCRISCLSLYYTRLAQQQEILARRSPRFTMIANLESDIRTSLFMAETISRATVQELRNFGLRGDAFYGESPENRHIWKRAVAADILIYEGHIEQFSLIHQMNAADNRPPNHYRKPVFANFPFMILQSCNSLKNSEIFLDRGIIGLIGSCSKIHSVSGSSFIKAYLDAMLYNGSNTGEALRDAKNYALSLVKLREAREHKEQDKTLRAALSFRLLGDPEARLFVRELPKPEKAPVTARLIGDSAIEVTTPTRFHDPITVDQYRLELFPVMETAGIITRFEGQGKSFKEINGFYFFRLPASHWKFLRDGSGPKLRNIDQTRNVILLDPYKRWFYFLNYPAQQIANRTFRIYF